MLLGKVLSIYLRTPVRTKQHNVIIVFNVEGLQSIVELIDILQSFCTLAARVAN